MINESYFWNLIANHYAHQPVADQEAYDKKLKHTQQYLTPDSRVLEFGCGTGSTAIHHASEVKHILATDISEQMLSIAREKARAASLENIAFEKCNLMDVNNPDEFWDVVLGMSILHLLPDREEHIQRVYKLLKPGGVFVSSTACIADMGTWFRFVAPIFRLLPLLPSVQVFGADSLKKSFIKAGFELEYEWQPTPSSAIFMVVRKPIK